MIINELNTLIKINKEEIYKLNLKHMFVQSNPDV